MPKKSKCLSSSSGSSTTCSLCSVTGLSSDSCSKNKDCSSSSSSSSCSVTNNCCSSSSTSCPSTSQSSCSSSCSSSCPSSSCSSSCPSSSSDSCGTSSSLTYTSKSSCSTSTASCSSSSTNSTCDPCDKKNDSCSETLKCEKRCDAECKNLVKNYKKCRDTLKANSDLIVLLEFIKNKLVAVKPNIDCRHMHNYTIECNVKWLESFVDTVFCVLRKNEAYKVIRVKDCKVKNACEESVCDRLYVVKAKYSNKSKTETKTLAINLYWSRLTYNDAKSFKGILDYTISEIDAEITSLKAQNTKPFLQ